MNKSRRVNFRCTQEQYDAMKRDAGYCGTTLSKHLVDTYFEAYPIDYKPPELREFFKGVDQIVDLKGKA